jgi:serine/threonine protein kinase
MAPEILLGCSDPSTLADVWSAAAVTAFVFTGRSLFGESPADQGQALTNIFEVLGRLSPLEVEEFRLQPLWLPGYELIDGGSDWDAEVVLAAGPGADKLLRQMLTFSWARCVFKHIALAKHHPPQTCQPPPFHYPVILLFVPISVSLQTFCSAVMICWLFFVFQTLEMILMDSIASHHFWTNPRSAF